MKEPKVRVDEDGVLRPVQTDDGREIPDSRPMAPPIGFVRRPQLHERIRAMVQHEYARARELQEVETPEEADDFVIPGEEGDDPREGRFALLPGYEWEESYEPPQDFKEMRQRLVDAGWTPPGEKAAAPAPTVTAAASQGDADPLHGGSGAQDSGKAPAAKVPAPKAR